MESLHPGLQALAGHDQFIVCRYVPKPNGKFDKIPFNVVTMCNCDAHDQVNWLSCDAAMGYAQMLGAEYGVGFVFTTADPFWFLDIDGCINLSQYNDVALDAFNRFPSALIEISHSGKGLHIIGSGPVPDHGTRCAEHGMEFYTEGGGRIF